ncbi:MAG: 39S ribosomal protein L51, mitochondrial [Alectoria sarmentosa]|nr:MAG: 39S ribosomal protein L51, mitochondrial [Alectoria sarmentosa]
MPVTALRTTSTAQNGVGAFILQCKRLDFHYCDKWGSSQGMNTFLRSPLIASFAKAHPQITIHISPRPNTHPIIRGSYINGREKVICVRNLEKEQILQKVELLRDANGEKVKRVKGGRVVGSLNEGVRGVWDPFHGGNKDILGDKILLN